MRFTLNASLVPSNPARSPVVLQHAASQPSPLLAGRQTTLQVSPKVPNVCGTIRQKFQVRHGRVRRLHDEFPPSLVLSFQRRARARKGRGCRQDSALYKRRTRVILIRTRPQGAEVKARLLVEAPRRRRRRRSSRAYMRVQSEDAPSRCTSSAKGGLSVPLIRLAKHLPNVNLISNLNFRDNSTVIHGPARCYGRRNERSLCTVADSRGLYAEV